MLGIDPLTPLEKRGMKSRAAYLSRRDSKMPPLRMESSRLDGGPMRIPFAAPAAKPKASLKTALADSGSVGSAKNPDSFIPTSTGRILLRDRKFGDSLPSIAETASSSAPG